ncbi:MAG: hypothetical protein AAGG38_02830 [Planctomycetota bacterium]
MNTNDLNRRVLKRLDEMVRLTRVIAHELGGTLLPSRIKDEELIQDPRWRRLDFQCQSLADHVKNRKADLDRFRAGRPDGAEPTSFSEWASTFEVYLSSLTHKQTRLRIKHEGEDRKSCDAPWTRSVAALIIALDEQQPESGWDHVDLTFELSPPDRLLVRVEIDPKPSEIVTVPTCVAELWHSEPERFVWDFAAAVLTFEV